MEPLKKIMLGIVLYAMLCAALILFLPNVIALDKTIFLTLNGINSSFLDSMFFVITYAGSSIFWILSIIILWMEKKRKASAYLMICFVLDTLFLAVLKTFFKRPRPDQMFSDIKMLRFDTEIGPSFPSGHTQRAFSGATILGALSKKARPFLIVLAILVAISRIYVGVHFPLDVLAGAINGVLLGMTALTFPYKKLIKGLESI
ncbi:MAG: phosphatase PAP2 family protein [Candidatus Aenigmarchaeota archaeon]|nr:phosphatase PAP2 family protein [Candidatus Aenigmarchaeota archaeon]